MRGAVTLCGHAFCSHDTQLQNIVDDYRLGPSKVFFNSIHSVSQTRPGLLSYVPQRIWSMVGVPPPHSPHLNCTSSYYRVLTYLSLFSCPDQSLLFWLIGSISINSLSCMHYTYYCLALFLSVQSLLVYSTGLAYIIGVFWYMCAGLPRVSR